ncbi:MAG: PfkB family carbohydrate kinase, partial [Bacteroidales bacterium]|nr:PfkB family carbohydrate kinase [Bacteroidales bacterium]
MVENMRKLVTHADIITPNVTEACLLLGERYQEKIEEYTIKSYAFRLSHQGPKNVVITSVSGKDTHSRYVMAYNKTSDKYFRVDIDYFPIEYPGAGDTFASVLCGAMLQGKSLEEAVTDATDFVYESIKVSFGEDYDSREGMLQEKMICRRSL